MFWLVALVLTGVSLFIGWRTNERLFATVEFQTQIISEQADMIVTLQEKLAPNDRRSKQRTDIDISFDR